MLVIEGDYDDMITVDARSEYDYQMGGNGLKVKLKGGPALTQMQADIEVLKQDMQKIKDQLAEESRLQEEHPALKDLYDQYQIVLQLVKKSDAALKASQ